MNIEHLRRSLKMQWLEYYRENRSWLTRLGVWVNCEGKRRPSSSFILATLSTLEPKLTQILPLVVDLSSNPDRIVIALGLNFNPDEELELLGSIEQAAIEERRLLPSKTSSLPELSTQTTEEAATPAPSGSEQPSEIGTSARPCPSAPTPYDRSSNRRPAMDTGELAPGQFPRDDESELNAQNNSASSAARTTP
jgi:hypothetical protein